MDNFLNIMKQDFSKDKWSIEIESFIFDVIVNHLMILFIS